MTSMEESQITKLVLGMTTRPEWSIEERRNRISRTIAEEVSRSDEVSQALLEHDILLKELQEKYQEVENVCEHLLIHYLKSEYVQMHRTPLYNVVAMKDSKKVFHLKLEELLKYKGSIKQQDVAITTRSVNGIMDPELRLALIINLIILLTIDNELIDLKSMYEYLIKHCKND